ncbi:MAG: RNA polymerase sigma factor RpoD/SigA [Vulcanimicrobiota bacterium]
MSEHAGLAREIPASADDEEPLSLSSYEAPEEEEHEEDYYLEEIEKNSLIKENQRLVYMLARKHMGQGIELSDLIQIGNLGLLKAVGKFDPLRGVQFSTYAYYWIQQTLMLALNTQSRIIRIPTHILVQVKRYYQAEERLFQKLEREPTSEEIAQEIFSFREESMSDQTQLKEGKLSLDDLVERAGERDKRMSQLRELEDVIHTSQAPVSLDAPYGELEDCTFYEAIPDRRTESPEDYFLRKYNIEEIRWLLSYLSERERHVVHKRFGLDGDDPWSFQEIGDTLGITKQGARKILVTALAKLKKMKTFAVKPPAKRSRAV